jgi:hypothetical protein
VTVERIVVKDVEFDTTAMLVLQNDLPILFKTTKPLNGNKNYSAPYWLTEPHEVGLFTVKDRKMIGQPENDPAVIATFSLRIGKDLIEVRKPVIYKWNDPVKGEMTRPFEVVPPVFVNVSDNVLIFKDDKPKTVRILLKSASQAKMEGVLTLRLPEGWRSSPAEIPFTLGKTGEEQSRTFEIFPSSAETTSTIKAIATIGGRAYDQAIRVIGYDHIPTQTLLPKAEVKVVRVDLKNENARIGYLKGAGDEVPVALRNMGFNVWEMKNEDVTPDNLKDLDAVVLGIRAINTNERIRFVMDPLLEYVKGGGTLVLQYNTNSDLETDNYAPFPLTISRDRVTDEDAVVKILKPDHKVMNHPNRITEKDFQGWVQERGLYFPNKWDDHYEAILSMHDKNEPEKEGSLLVAKYGNGYYVYTGLSFFRELPEGVAGAYKLFSNIVSLSKSNVAPPAVPLEAKSKKKRSKS